MELSEQDGRALDSQPSEDDGEGPNASCSTDARRGADALANQGEENSGPRVTQALADEVSGRATGPRSGALEAREAREPEAQPSQGAPPLPSADRRASLEGQAPPCGPVQTALERDPYLAAGVLPFCVLGGDMLFLLGQELRFRSRSRSSSLADAEEGGAHSSTRGGADVGSAGNDGRLAAHVRRALASSAFRTSSPGGETSRDERRIHSPSSPCTATATDAGTRGRAPTHTRDISIDQGQEQSEMTPGNPPPEAPELLPEALDDNGSIHGSEGLRVGPSRTPVPASAPQGVPHTASGQSAADAKICGGPSAAAPGGGAPENVPAGLLWSDFGGGREARDADAVETASREFAEESFGLFNGVRLEDDSIARSQAAMETVLRDSTLRGKRVFECRNGGYVMFVAEVDFVPDIMMKLARKEIVAGRHHGQKGACEGGGGGGGDRYDLGGSLDAGATREEGYEAGPGACVSSGLSEKTDFAWVPASSLLKAMHESRHRSTRKVVVKLGGCRYLRLFHKFVISLWGLDLAGVIKAASSPVQRRRQPFPSPRALLLQAGRQGDTVRLSPRPKSVNDCDEKRITSSGEGDGNGSALTIAIKPGGCAIRGIDCIRPSFLSGRKRTNLGIIDQTPARRKPWARRRDSRRGGGRGGGDGAGASTGQKLQLSADGVRGEESDAAGAATVGVTRAAAFSGDLRGGDRAGSDGDVGESGVKHTRTRGRKSGAACRKIRRRRKEERRLRAAAVAVAAAAGATTGSTERRAPCPSASLPPTLEA